ncbi:MAG: TMEM165/GDT1 family protein [Thermostichales cyanobacterium BF4_bins_65]
MTWASLTALLASLLLIFISELGDKTFFVAAVLAMRYPRRWVWVGAFSALAVMTVISAGLGQVVRLLPKVYTHYAGVIVLLGFGAILLKQAWDCRHEHHLQEAAEAQDLVAQTDWLGSLTIVASSFSLTFLAEWGDRTQMATIDLATVYDPLGVMLMGMLAHGLCTLLAVAAGQGLQRYLSKGMMAAIGGGLFVTFGLLSWGQGLA